MEDKWRFLYYDCQDISDNLYLLICYLKTISSVDENNVEYVDYIPTYDIWWQSGQIMSEKKIQRALKEGREKKLNDEHYLIELVDDRYYIRDLDVNKEKIKVNILADLLKKTKVDTDMKVKRTSAKEIRIYIYCHMMWRLSNEGRKYTPEITTKKIGENIYKSVTWNPKSTKATAITECVEHLREIGYILYRDKVDRCKKYRKLVALKK